MSFIKKSAATIALLGSASFAFASAIDIDGLTPLEQNYGMNFDRSTLEAAIVNIQEQAGKELSSQETLEQLGVTFKALRSDPDYRDLCASEFRSELSD